MQIDIILEPDRTPAEVAELAVLAERAGIGALWHQNYASGPDAFIGLVDAARATSRLGLGVVIVSPWEMHPLKMANVLFTLNEYCGGRARLVVGGGGEWGPAMGIRPERRVRAEREAIEILKGASPDHWLRYDGELYQARGYRPAYARARPPVVYAGASREQMLRMGGRVADGVMMSDVPRQRIARAVDFVREGLAARDTRPQALRISNIWAWHVKKDRAAAAHEARRELALRGALDRWYVEAVLDEDDAELVMAQRSAFFRAYRSRSSRVEGVPERIVQRLVEELTLTGTPAELDGRLEELRAFAEAGVNELAFRLHDDPAEAIDLIARHVVPAFADRDGGDRPAGRD